MRSPRNPVRFNLNITTPEGREQMILELQTKADFLKELDGEFTTLLEEWFFSMGGTKEELELELAKYLRGDDVPPERI